MNKPYDEDADAPDVSKLTTTQLLAEIEALKQALKAKPVPTRSSRLESLTLDILVESIRQVLGWDVQHREDTQHYLDLGMVEQDSQERTLLARIEVLAWDMTGGLFDKDEDGA